MYRWWNVDWAYFYLYINVFVVMCGAATSYLEVAAGCKLALANSNLFSLVCFELYWDVYWHTHSPFFLCLDFTCDSERCASSTRIGNVFGS